MDKVRLRDFVEMLELEIVHESTDYDDVYLTSRDINRPGLQLAGYMEQFPYERIQLIGQVEHTYYQTLDSRTCYERFRSIFSFDIPAMIFSRGLDIRRDILDLAWHYDKSFFRSALPTTTLITRMNTTLEQLLAEEKTIHGVLVEIFGSGVLILGESAVGKSETALDLIIRGHRLVADDVVIIKKMSAGLLGTSPENIRHFMEIRGLGILDIGRLYGLGSVKSEEYIDLVIELKLWHEDEYDRLGLDEDKMEILGREVPRVTIPVKTGRNLAMIIEVATRNQRQKALGYNAAMELDKRLFSKKG